MPVQIRYVTGWARGDCWLAQSPHHDNGIWQMKGELPPKQFDCEAAAKSYLITRGYDLPQQQVVYEQSGAI